MPTINRETNVIDAILFLLLSHGHIESRATKTKATLKQAAPAAAAAPAVAAPAAAVAAAADDDDEDIDLFDFGKHLIRFIVDNKRHGER